MTPRLALLLAALAACDAGTSHPVPQVVVSVPPQAWFVERLAGDAVEIAVLLPPGASPAHHEPSMRELEALARAQLYVRVGHPGFPLEGAWLDARLAERPDLKVVSAAEELPDDDQDPHTWVSPRHARALAEGVARDLSQLLPERVDAIAANLVQLLAEIDRVDAELREKLADKRGGSFLVFHPAWGHLAREYGLVQVAIEREGKNPDPASLARLIREARDAGVRVVFAQPQFDPSGAQLVADEIGARVEMLDPLAYDWPANLRHVGESLANAVVLP